MVDDFGLMTILGFWDSNTNCIGYVFWHGYRSSSRRFRRSIQDIGGFQQSPSKITTFLHFGTAKNISLDCLIITLRQNLMLFSIVGLLHLILCYQKFSILFWWTNGQSCYDQSFVSWCSVNREHYCLSSSWPSLSSEHISDSNLVSELKEESFHFSIW